jgi:hypothetical protein
MRKTAATLLALAAGVSASVYAEPLLLAPGKSVTVVAAADTNVRVVITAPAGEALDLDALFAAADPKGGVHSLATRRQVRSASAVVRNADGSLSLGPASLPPAAAARSIDGGVIVFSAGQYTLQEEVPANPPAQPDLLKELLDRRDRPAKPPLPIDIGVFRR